MMHEGLFAFYLLFGFLIGFVLSNFINKEAARLYKDIYNMNITLKQKLSELNDHLKNLTNKI